MSCCKPPTWKLYYEVSGMCVSELVRAYSELGARLRRMIMERQLKHEEAEGPQGKWQVSTIRTDAGGADEYRPSAMGVSGMVVSPLSSADYIDETPWPFETMVFKGGAFGHHHRAYKSLEDALAGHDEIVATIKGGTMEVGAGIRGPFGAPSLTPEEWRAGKSQGPNMQNYDPFTVKAAERPSARP